MADPVQRLLEAFKPGRMLGDRRFTETVNVRAVSPSDSKTDPQQLIDIVLGSETTPPSGMYLDPAMKDPARRTEKLRSLTVNSNYPKIGQVWEEVKKRYPYAATGVDKVAILPSVTNKYIAGAAPSLPFNYEVLGVAPAIEQESPDTIMDTLVHELSHVSQYQNFPTFGSRRMMTKPVRAYLERPHEQQAYDVEFARQRVDQDKRARAI